MKTAEYVHALRKLARDCSFTNISAEQYREELTRDAFINGLTSSNIRQRLGLLEEDELDFKTVIDRAEILDRALKQSNFYASGQSSFISVTAMSKEKLEAQEEENLSTLQISKTTYPPNSTQKKKCFFFAGKTCIHVVEITVLPKQRLTSTVENLVISCEYVKADPPKQHRLSTLFKTRMK